MPVTVVGPHEYPPSERLPLDVVDVTSRSKSFGRGLSPFVLGPVDLYDGADPPRACTVEGAWQFSKVFREHLSPNGAILASYFKWAKAGWSSPRANRHPMGKGAKPEFLLWGSRRLDYVTARLEVYYPLYAGAALRSAAFRTLREAYAAREHSLTLWDWDGYDHRAAGKSWSDVFYDPTRPCGHGFMLGWMLENIE